MSGLGGPEPYTVSSFLLELASRAFQQSFNLICGTVGTIVISCVGALVTALLVRFFRGRKAFMEHIKANILIALAGAVITWFIVFCGLLAWQPHNIDSEASRNSPPPMTFPLPPPPPWTFEPPPAAIEIFLHAHKGFDLEPPSGRVVFENKRQYSLIIINSGEKPILSTELQVAFPFPVEAQNIIRTQGVTGVTFGPWRPFSWPGPGGGIETPNCLATGSYKLRIAQLNPHGKLEIGVILNNSPYLGRVGIDYVCGHFNSWYHGRLVRAEYFAPFELKEGVVGLGAVRTKPAKLRSAVVFQILLAPCIPNGSLKEEFHLPGTAEY
jgi:uncharacterized membrane protein YeaQ/YmgE (transglycosylase-associated protein family)